ncbi:unnamed protein product [Lampetra fluviatilis]
MTTVATATAAVVPAGAREDCERGRQGRDERRGQEGHRALHVAAADTLTGGGGRASRGVGGTGERDGRYGASSQSWRCVPCRRKHKWGEQIAETKDGVNLAICSPLLCLRSSPSGPIFPVAQHDERPVAQQAPTTPQILQGAISQSKRAQAKHVSQ